MTVIGLVQIVLFCGALLACVKPLGLYIKAVVEGETTFLKPVLEPVERLCYKVSGVDPEEDMPWTEYATALLAFSCVTVLLTYGLLKFQGDLPFNPMHFSSLLAPAYATTVTSDLIFNTAVSFSSNTNWQAYSGENTLSYLVADARSCLSQLGFVRRWELLLRSPLLAALPDGWQPVSAISGKTLFESRSMYYCRSLS